jgi:hypothetical protein
MKILNPNNLPEIIVRAVTNDPYDAGNTDISVTSLIAPIQQRYLQKKHNSKLTENVEDRIWALLGSSVHSVIERAASEGDIVEERYFQKIEGYNVSGQIDLIASNALYDFKVTSAFAVLGDHKPEWEYQLNLLHYLANNPEIKKLAIIAILRDWSKFRAMKGGDYPKAQVIEIPIPLWDREKQEKYLLDRLRGHMRAIEDNSMPDCTDSEKWAKEAVYAVMKKGRKTAVKLHTSMAEAEAHIDKLDDKHSVTVREGEDVRCGNYCSVKNYCKQYLGE